MPQLCDMKLCTGCSACFNSCPNNSIRMQPDSNGFLYPVINPKTCINCVVCEISCPVLNPPTKTNCLEKPKVYACINKDNKILNESTSGGAFSAFSNHIIELNGHIFGAAYNEKMEVIHVGIDNIKQLHKLRKSKYTQSAIGQTFKSASILLNQNKYVFYTGTPCQIAGLYSYLGINNDKLITAEIICHGTPSPLLFSKFLSYIEKNNEQKIVDINFRDKKYGWDNGMVLSCEFENKRKKYLRFKYSSYIKFFLSSINLRESCYNCCFKQLPKVADITLGDFWGIGENIKYDLMQIKKNGISLVMVHSEKGEIFFKQVSAELITNERTYDEAIIRNRSFLRSQNRHKQYDNFKNDLINKEYPFLIRKYAPLNYRRITYEIVANIFGAKGLKHLVQLAKNN